MSNGLKLLLIDGNNMSHRVYWTHQGLSYKGTATGVLYGFFRQLVALHKKYPDYFRVVVWDRGYTRRLEESKKAVEAGVIPSAYKENHKDSTDEHVQAVREQMEQLKDALKMVRCVQASISGCEADDVINSYAKYVEQWKGEAIVVSSDRDFYQVISPSVSIYDAMKDEVWTLERFEKEFCFSPPSWVEVGALMGDKGDNIFGVEGWAPVTACKYIRQYGNVDAVVAAVQAKTKRSKTEQALLDSMPRLALAKSLKAMDIVPGIPRPRILSSLDVEALKKWFLEWSFVSLLKDAWRLV